MRSTNTFGVHFMIRRNKVKNNLAPIYARITVDARRIEISLKRKINPNEWDPVNGKAKGKSPEARMLNSFLDENLILLYDYYHELQKRKELITADAIKNMFLGIDEKDFSLKKLVEYHNEVMKTTLAWGTMKNYYTTQKYIQEFVQKKYKTSDVFLCKLTYRFISDFEFFLRNRQPNDHQRPMGNNGVMKHLERFRKMINMAVRMEWLEKDPFERYQLKFNKVERGYLTEEELEKIEAKKISIERMQFIRDIFVFSCYTGLAYIDAIKLSPDDIIRGIDGEHWISIKREKTDVPVRVPILPVAWQLIEKYKTHPRSEKNNTVFPFITNQRLNSYLKELADICGIKKNLTFHLARHTFATTVTLTNGVPIETVSKMLGHSKMATTQIYAKVIERKVGEDMKTLKDKMYPQKVLKSVK